MSEGPTESAGADTHETAPKTRIIDIYTKTREFHIELRGDWFNVRKGEQGDIFAHGHKDARGWQLASRLPVAGPGTIYPDLYELMRALLILD